MQVQVPFSLAETLAPGITRDQLGPLMELVMHLLVERIGSLDENGLASMPVR
jgi:hypothetical protein